jgi:hypothetical protein
LFIPRNKNQVYCPRKRCQRYRKNKWQQEKIRSDETYRESQIDAVQLWRLKNPDYMKEYRKKHPAYTKRNREQQKKRRTGSQTPLLRQNPEVVKMDATMASFPVITGTYRLIPSGVVKMDAIVVQLTVLQPDASLHEAAL